MHRQLADQHIELTPHKVGPEGVGGDRHAAQLGQAVEDIR